MKYPSLEAKRKIRNAEGFSLVELLVVIAVIGVIAAIAVAVMTGIRDRSVVERNRNNAQSLVNVYTAARGAGVRFQAATLDNLVGQLRTGKNGPGLLASTTFRFDLPVEVTAVSPYIEFVPPLGPSGNETVAYKTGAN